MKKDFTGQKYNMWAFIRPVDSKWEVQCDCGTITIRSHYDIVRGHSKSCGCRNIKDYTGQKFGKLTFIRPTDEIKHGYVVWELQCECGNTTSKPARNVVSGSTISCGCKLQELRASLGEKAIRLHSPMISSARARWRAYVNKDKEMCDFDTFFTLSQQPCHYCGRPPHRVARLLQSESRRRSANQIENGDFTYNGLDRIDSNKGHTVDNIVPCCWDCNHMKGKRSVEEFFAHMERIRLHTASKKLSSDIGGVVDSV